MRKMCRRVTACFLLAAFVWFGTLLSDRQRLNEELIRLHVVANSDTEGDQTLKLCVRDAVTESIKDAMQGISDADQAKRYIRENLSKIEAVANRVLEEAGSSDRATAALQEEAFDTRYYDTFSLPAGVYEALRITIGEGAGHNWWCVVFPTLCLPATTDGFEDVAAGAGFPDSLTGALEGEQGYEIRFFLLDMLGKLENKLQVG